MDRSQIVRALRRWGWLMLLIPALIGATSFLVSRLLPPVYSATATILVQQQASSVTGPQYQDVLASERLARTFGQMILTDPILRQVSAQLNLSETPEQLSKRLSTRLVRDTQLIQITAEDRDPEAAARLANAVAQSFQEQSRRYALGGMVTSKENLARQISKLSTDIDNNNLLVDRLRGTVVSGNGTAQDTIMMQQLQTELNQMQVTYSNLLKTLQELELAEARAAEGLRLIESAVPPLRPARPNIPLNTLAGLLVGLALSAALILLLQHADDTLKASEDVTETLNLPVLGTVREFKAQRDARKVDLEGFARSLRKGKVDFAAFGPLFRGATQAPGPLDDRTHDLITIRSPRSGASEGYRTLRTNLQFSSLDAPVHTLVVTSAASGDGKSTVSANLAVAMAQAGKRVLLVDGDLRRPSLHQMFGTSNRNGLATLLLGDGATIDSVAVDTPEPNLRLIPSGPLPANPAEVLGSARMRRLLEEMESQADVVVLDTAPVLAVADALELAGAADATLLVVRSGYTRSGLAERAREQLKRIEARLLGVVVNAIPRESDSSAYYTYRYYQSSPTRPAYRNGHTPPAESAELLEVEK